MDCPIDVCLDRVKLRNRCIPGYTEEEIFARVDAIDRKNFLTVISSKHRADVVVDTYDRKSNNDFVGMKKTPSIDWQAKAVNKSLQLINE